MALKLVIVGGVAAGAAAATRARRLDEQAEIVIFEKSGYVSFANCGLPYHVGAIIPDRGSLLITTPEQFRDRFNVDVRVRHEVLSIDRAGKSVRVRNLDSGAEFDEPYDKLILTPGARAVVPPIPGLDAPNVFSLRTVEDMDRFKGWLDSNACRRVSVVGAGFIGLEVAEVLRHRGLDVDLIERLDQVLPPLDADMARPVEQHLRARGVKLHLGAGLEAVKTRDGQAVAVLTADGQTIDADAVLVSIGVRPASELARAADLPVSEKGAIQVDDQLQAGDPDIFAAGDAIEVISAITGQPCFVPLAGPAAKHGRSAGERAVTGGAVSRARVAGTAIVQVFDQTAAVTGLNLRAAEAAGLSAGYAVVRRGHHVDYYPGAEPMTIKLVYDRKTNRVLGGQIVGGAGVDRRIDVLASVIHFGGTLADLAELDLAYAPQYGAAKDPLHIAAQAALNEQAGLVRHAHPDDVARACQGDCQLIDVRPPDVVALGSIPGARNLPLGRLRNRLSELDPGRPVLVFCNVGHSSYIAARILQQRGFGQVRSLAGGFQWYAAQGFPTTVAM